MEDALKLRKNIVESSKLLWRGMLPRPRLRCAPMYALVQPSEKECAEAKEEIVHERI
jgi:hypothetical protein